jgi:WS/DGAT/MGAT family acyltransferase
MNAGVLTEPLILPSQMLPSDALFWYAEQATPGIRPLVAGLFLLDRPPNHQKFEQAMQRWVHSIPRLRQKVREVPFSLTLPQWVEDPTFDLSYHLREIELPPPGSRKQLFELVSALFASPLDRERPLWEAYVLRGFEGHRAAIFVKVHHCVMDGVGSMAGFDAMTQRRRNEPLPPLRLRRSKANPPPPVELAQALASAAERLASLGKGAAQLAFEAIRNPTQVVERGVAAARGLRGLWQDLTAPRVDDPIAARATGIGRRLDGMTLDLEQLRAAKARLGVTLNDFMLTVFATAVGRYYRSHGVTLNELHCMVPISLRQESERYQLGNRVGMCNVRLPIGELEPEERLRRIQAQTLAAKRDRRGAAYPLLMQLLAITPGFVFRELAESAIGQINLIVTNVPGPPQIRCIAGAKIEEIYPYAPIAEKLPLSIALLSYAKNYGIGIDTDPAAIPDPDRLHALIHEATKELVSFAAKKAPAAAPGQQRSRNTRPATRTARSSRQPAPA